jgi:hypothetical protein
VTRRATLVIRYAPIINTADVSSKLPLMER